MERCKTEGTLLFSAKNGDRVYRYYKSIVVHFAGKRKTVSTSILNGGYREDLEAIFNHDCNPGAGLPCTMRADTYEKHMRLVAKELGLHPDRVSGIGTAASMENVSIKTLSYKEIEVTAIVTGGVEVNGGRVGDPATYYNPIDRSKLHKPGTINILLLLDVDLPPGIVARAMVTATEAKTAALQELMAGSNYSSGLATGSGTDSTIVTANPSSPIYLEGAGKHSKLGELIGRTVKDAVKEALYLQTGLGAKEQFSVLRRFKRFGLKEETVWELYAALEKGARKAEVFDALYRLDKEKEFVVAASLYIHLIDQYNWGLIEGDEARKAAVLLLANFTEKYGLKVSAYDEAYDEASAVKHWAEFFATLLRKKYRGKKSEPLEMREGEEETK